MLKTISLLISLAMSIVLAGNVAYTLESNPEYIFVSELSPGEYLPELYAADNKIPIHKEPSKFSPIIEQFMIKKGAKITFDETRYCTIKPAIVKTLKSTYLYEASKYGKLNYLSIKTYYDGGSGSMGSKFPLKSGEVIEYLQYRAEGQCIFRLHDDIHAGSCNWQGLTANNEDFKIESSPINELWARVTNNKKSVGWFLVEKRYVTGFTLPQDW